MGARGKRKPIYSEGYCLERDEQGRACLHIANHAEVLAGLDARGEWPMNEHRRYPHTAGLVVEPAKRGDRVVDRTGGTWEKATTLWHHVAGPRQDWKGRYPFSVVLSQHGPLRLPGKTVEESR